MDRKEERRNKFNRKKKFKKLTRSSNVKTERKKTKGKPNENKDNIWKPEQEHLWKGVGKPKESVSKI